MEGKLNIAMFGHKRIPSREGGIEIVVEEIATRLARMGHQVTCYNRAGHHVSGEKFDTEKISAYKGVRLKTVPTIEKKGFAAVTSSFFAAVVTAFGKYDAVHIHAEGPAAFCWLPKLFGKRVIVTIHGLDWQREKWKSGFGSKYIHFGEKMAVKYSDEIIVLSEDVQSYFKKTYNRETNFIPNGVNRPQIENAEIITEKYGLEKDGYILYLGRLVPEKGEHYLVEAFKGIKTNKKLVIAGGASDTDEYTEKLKSLAEGDDRIIFTGFVQGKILDELYSNAYVYCLPSDLEGMPLSLLEAMSYGNCCLVSDIPECTEVVDDKAVLFRKSDISDLRQKLSSPTAIYNVAYTVASILLIFWDSIDASYAPWIYQKLEEKSYESINLRGKQILLLFAGTTIFSTLFAPEIIRVLAPSSYYSGIYVIPSVAAGVFFTALYSLYMRVELYAKQTKKVTVATFCAALINIVLNYIFIPIFGFYAAGYTTLVSYIFLAVFHYFNVKKIGYGFVYNVKPLLLISAGVLVSIVFISAIYEYAIIRYALIVAILLVGILKRKDIIKLIKKPM